MVLLRFIETIKLVSEFSVGERDHLIIKPFFIAGLIHGAKQDACPLGIESEKCPDRLTATLNTKLFHIDIARAFKRISIGSG